MSFIMQYVHSCCIVTFLSSFSFDFSRTSKFVLFLFVACKIIQSNYTCGKRNCFYSVCSACGWAASSTTFSISHTKTTTTALFWRRCSNSERNVSKRWRTFHIWTTQTTWRKQRSCCQPSFTKRCLSTDCIFFLFATKVQHKSLFMCMHVQMLSLFLLLLIYQCF